MTIIDARPAEDIDEARFPGAVDEARGAGHREDAPEESATDQPAAATEPADEDRALPVEADLAGETAVALTQGVQHRRRARRRSRGGRGGGGCTGNQPR